MIPVIEHRELGGDWVEGLFIINEVSAYLALQVGIPEATIQARIIEAHGYCLRPPKSGEKVICMDGRLYAVDDLAIRAMQRVIFDFVSVPEVHAIVGAYLVEENGDAYRAAGIYLDNEVHPYVVIAVLNTLSDEGRLPPHPSWS
ncbi:MAG: hypothetical protein M3Q49_06200 [Actinomycetota bacterium]|nr:hypothetical protein [Actinomycetota bacterium]